MGYDFKSLSSYDFALLTRDLLQVVLEKRLETFSEGPDCGIDFRYHDSSSNLMVQSKHYAKSGYNALVSMLRRKERPKVERLQPTRYLLATSVSLTPTRMTRRHSLGTELYLTILLKSIRSESMNVRSSPLSLWQNCGRNKLKSVYKNGSRCQQM